MKLLASLSLLALAACGASYEDAPRSQRAQTRLDRALDGKVAGEPQRCISRFRRNEQEIVDRNTILFKNGRDLVYRNDPEGGCGGLDPTRAILINTIGDGDFCRGDIIRVFDTTSGSTVGSCAFSDFIPYRRPGSRAGRGS